MNPLEIWKAPVEDQSKTLSIELTNSCNLHCTYCVRDEDALYHTKAEFFPPDLLAKIAQEAKQTFDLTHISFTGGEPAIHPQFERIIQVVSEHGLKCSFVTNGWHFDRIYPVILRNRRAISQIAFSLDGPTKSQHDYWRGEGSFVRVMKAFARCHHSNIPFGLKVGIRRDTAPFLQEFALLGARFGAKALHFSHLLPTSETSEIENALTIEERLDAEHEIAILSNIFKMKVGVDTGYLNTNPAVPCVALKGNQPNVDYQGRLNLCCNLSGYRGATSEGDVVGDLKSERFFDAYQVLLQVADAQVRRRGEALKRMHDSGSAADLYTSSPCLFCLKSFGKIPWRNAGSNSGRSLPVLK